MTREDKKEVKQIVKEIVGPEFEEVNNKFDKLDKRLGKMDKRFNRLEDKIEASVEIFKEHMSSKMRVFKDYIDGKDEKTNRRIDEVESQNKTTWNLVLEHDRKLRAKA